MLTETAEGLYCEAGDFHIDPWGAVPRALITHAHGDHARAGSAAYLCADASAPLLARRFGPDVPIESQPYGRVLTIGGTRVSFHPAGHVLGSAQIRVEGPDGVWVVSGDYKRAADPTCAPFEPVPCDVFVTESTFALPIYRWDDDRRRDRRPRRVVGRQPRARPDVDRVLLHDRQGAAAARRDRARHRSPDLGARRAAADDRGLSRRRHRDGADAGADRAPARHLVRRRAGAGAAVGARDAVDAPARRSLRRARLRADARARRPPPARLRSRLRPVRSRRLAGAARHHRGDRRQPRAGDARPRRAAGALPARAGRRRRRHPHRLGRRRRRRRVTNEGVRHPLRRHRRDDVDQRQGRGHRPLSGGGAGRRRGVGGVLPHRPAVEAPAALPRHLGLDDDARRRRGMAARRVLQRRRRRRRNGDADPRSGSQRLRSRSA